MFNSHDMFEESTLFLRTHRVSLDVLVCFKGLQWTVTIFFLKITCLLVGIDKNCCFEERFLWLFLFNQSWRAGTYYFFD